VDCLPERVETEHYYFDVVETPGHCRGHIALVERAKGWCFSGDLFVSREPKVIRPEEDLAEVARSMKKLVDLQTNGLILFTSLGTVVQDGRESLQSCIAYLRESSQRAKELKKQGLSITAIRDKLFGRESILAELSDGDISAENMVRGLLRARI